MNKTTVPPSLLDSYGAARAYVQKYNRTPKAERFGAMVPAEQVYRLSRDFLDACAMLSKAKRR